MLTREMNTFLTRTGPGTPMGELFRRYWIPALLDWELPERDCPPVRVKLLGEKLVAFRDTAGRIGMIEEFCAHRGVSLWFGRNEECGLRCPYHGWKYDVNGQCVDLPSEPEESGVRRGIKLKSYPCVELGGVIWTYMGPPEEKPPLPSFEWVHLPPSHRVTTKRWQESNYLQAIEGGIDSSHVSFLHRGDLATDPFHRNTAGAKFAKSTKTTFHIVDSAGGLIIGARREADPAVDHAVVHPHSPLRRQRAQRTCVGAHGRRKLHGVVDDVSSRPPHTRGAYRAHQGRQRRSCRADTWDVPSCGEPQQRLPDRSCQTEERPPLQRRQGPRHAGRVGPGKHGTHRGPDQGASPLHRPSHHCRAPASGESGE